jgi:hypothetical protein
MPEISVVILAVIIFLLIFNDIHGNTRNTWEEEEERLKREIIAEIDEALQIIRKP